MPGHFLTWGLLGLGSVQDAGCQSSCECHLRVLLHQFFPRVLCSCSLLYVTFFSKEFLISLYFHHVCNKWLNMSSINQGFFYFITGSRTNEGKASWRKVTYWRLFNWLAGWRISCSGAQYWRRVCFVRALVLLTPLKHKDLESKMCVLLDIHFPCPFQAISDMSIFLLL